MSPYLLSNSLLLFPCTYLSISLSSSLYQSHHLIMLFTEYCVYVCIYYLPPTLSLSLCTCSNASWQVLHVYMDMSLFQPVKAYMPSHCTLIYVYVYLKRERERSLPIEYTLVNAYNATIYILVLVHRHQWKFNWDINAPEVIHVL